MAQLTAAPDSPPARDVLTRDEALARAERVRNAAYQIDVDIRADRDTFTATTTLAFDLEGVREPLFLDFRGDGIRELTVNGPLGSPRTCAATDCGWTRPCSGRTCPSASRTSAGSTARATASTVSWTRRTARPTSTRTSSPSPRTGSSRASTSRISRRATSSASTAPAEWEVISAGRTVAQSRVSDGLRRHTLRDDAALQHLPAAARRRAVRRHADRAPGHPAGAVRAPFPGPPARRERRRAVRGHAPGLRLLRRPLRSALRVHQVRPALHARVQHRRHGERGRGHLPRQLPVPRPAHRDAAARARGGRCCTSWRTCGSATW